MLSNIERANTAIKVVQGVMASIGKEAPDAWRNLDKAVALRPRVMFQTPDRWPPWCFLPIEVFQKCNPLGAKAEHVSMLYPMATSVGAWRRTQGVYLFEDTVLEELWNTPITGDIPVELLQRLPEQAPMLILPPGAFCNSVEGGPSEAAIVQLTTVSRFKALMIMLIDSDGKTGNLSIPLIGTLDQSVAWVCNALRSTSNGEVAIDGMTYKAVGYELRANTSGSEFAISVFEQNRKDIAGLLSLMLYLCSEEPEMTTVPKPLVTKTKKGPRVFPPNKPTFVHVGVQLGAALRKATYRERTEHEVQGTHASPRPHIRRAHWHTFWAGPRIGPREQRVKWLPAIPINTQFSVIEPVVHPVGVAWKPEESKV